MGSDRD